MDERIKAHNEGLGAKYTRGRRPVELVYVEEYETRREAMRREVKIKRLSRKDKLNMIQRGSGDDAFRTARLEESE